MGRRTPAGIYANSGYRMRYYSAAREVPTIIMHLVEFFLLSYFFM